MTYVPYIALYQDGHQVQGVGISRRLTLIRLNYVSIFIEEFESRPKCMSNFLKFLFFFETTQPPPLMVDQNVSAFARINIS
jgi:hypothetical protein